MVSNNAFTGVGNGVLAAGMSWTLRAAAAVNPAAAVAHPIFVAHATAAIPQRKRRTAATAASVDWGTA